MAFLWNRQKGEQLPTSGRDDTDNVHIGIVYNVTFLGSMLVPTPTGHGSSRTATAVEKVYLEKYKAFGYGSKKIRLEVSTDEVRIIRKDGGSEALVTFQMNTVTYFSLDLKHDKAFVFVVGDEKNKTYRAYVLHCENCTRAREISIKFKEAFKLKEIKSEEMRLRSLSLPNTTRQRSSSQQTSEKGADDWGLFQTGETDLRPRSKTENVASKQCILGEKLAVEENIVKSVASNDTGVAEVEKFEGGEDEFTLLAEKRLRSFDDHAMPGTFENKLLLDQDSSHPQKHTLFNFGTSSRNESQTSNNTMSFENKNLLEL